MIQLTSKFSSHVHFEEESQPSRSVVIYYYSSDANGTVWGLTDVSGTVVWSADYDSYGNATFSGTIDQPLRMPGQYEDAESGLSYNLARYYDPTTGRYLSVDPLRDAEDYTYAGGNPLKYVDPTGEQVDVVFDYSLGIVTVTDVDTKKSVTANAFSGMGAGRNNPEMQNESFFGPIPLGAYELLNDRNPKDPSRHGEKWFEIDAQDKIRRDDTFNKNGRGNFRFHPGTISLGCVTVDNDNGANYQKWLEIVELIKKTKSKIVTDNDGRKRTNFGQVTVRR